LGQTIAISVCGYLQRARPPSQRQRRRSESRRHWL